MTDAELFDTFCLSPRPDLGSAELIFAGLRAVAARARAEALEWCARFCDDRCDDPNIAAAIRARAAGGGER